MESWWTILIHVPGSGPIRLGHFHLPLRRPLSGPLHADWAAGPNRIAPDSLLLGPPVPTGPRPKPSLGRTSGDLITCWNSNRFSCNEVSERTYSLTLLLTHLTSGKTFYLTNVYGPPNWDGKEAFWLELLSLKDVCTNSWVICGDFNCIKNQSERKGLPWSRKAMALFSDLINNLEVIDLPLSNQTYTWSNMQQRPTLAKLDRFLVSTEWDLSFPIARTDLKSQLQQILVEEEILWKTRFKQLWLKEGDRNTKFFHAMANGRKHINSITVIEDEAGDQLRNEELKRSRCYHYFRRLFGQWEERTQSHSDWSSLYHSNRLPQLEVLTSPFNIEEVKNATFQLGGDKAPGPNEFPLLFFQKFWETVKDDIFKIFTKLQEDDTIFFCQSTKQCMRNLRFLWKTFILASGLKINMDKSELYYVGSNPHRATRLAIILGCAVGNLPFCYLGLPLYHKRLRKEDWAIIINRINTRIEGWKAKLLSQGGRFTLVNSILTSLPLHCLSIYKAPQWVLQRIEALRREPSSGRVPKSPEGGMLPCQLENNI
ncbi:putative ribonuclease H protein [Ananas comosus]|uniref:Putative ribonuclease H protein n=1 Tax=Ananas comosus TaxID=4615 RepID=A0A199VWU2_ANACO|nr:putative ribonuclease H protein [Ananas comosus]